MLRSRMSDSATVARTHQAVTQDRQLYGRGDHHQTWSLSLVCGVSRLRGDSMSFHGREFPWCGCVPHTSCRCVVVARVCCEGEHTR